MPDPALSVVIPTFNRRVTLLRCLEALRQQTVTPDSFEVVLVDDGSSDGTPDIVAQVQEEWGARLRFYRQPNRGPATARNRGVREAKGGIVLFIGDDIVAHPDLLRRHQEAHRRQPEESVALLGLTTWDPERKTTPFMRWLENGGPQYKYWSIQDPENVGYVHFYTSNISLKRAFLLEKGLFDEEFPYASYEDIELGSRLESQGLRIVYDAEAVGYHDHTTRLRDALRRMERVGESRLLFESKTGRRPPLQGAQGPLHSLLAGLKFRLYYRLGALAEDRIVLPWVYAYLMDKALWRGYWRHAKTM